MQCSGNKGDTNNKYEHQSTVNNNMPLRQLIYVGWVYKHLTRNENIYGRRKIGIPEPRFVVFYNGKAECPERQELRLSMNVQLS